MPQTQQEYEDEEFKKYCEDTPVFLPDEYDEILTNIRHCEQNIAMYESELHSAQCELRKYKRRLAYLNDIKPAKSQK